MSPHAEVRLAFMELYLRGQVAADDIDDFIDNWHESPGSQELFEYLGMTKDEYARWLRDPGTLPDMAGASERNSTHTSLRK